MKNASYSTLNKGVCLVNVTYYYHHPDETMIFEVSDYILEWRPWVPCQNLSAPTLPLHSGTFLGKTLATLWLGAFSGL